MTEGARSDDVRRSATGHSSGLGKLVVAGRIMFLASWVLPAAQITVPVPAASTTLHGDSDLIFGWQAARITWRLLTSILSNDASGDPYWHGVVLSATVLTNVVMLLSFIRFSAGRTNVCIGIALLACALLNTSWLYLLKDEARTNLPGYYCWLASFALAGIGMLMRRRSAA